jgi:DNA repair protein RadC
MQKTKAKPYNFIDNDIIIDSSISKKYVLRIKDLSDGDKPREKMISGGPSILSTEELLSIILNSGTKKEEVFHMASRVLKEYGDKNISNQRNAELLSTEMDIPIVKACQIVACFEIGRRFFDKRNGRQLTVRTAKNAYDYLKDMKNLPKEQLRGLYLNSRYKLIHDEVISVGSLTSSIVHPREVFKPAIEYSAAAIIIAHNHPSGSSKPTIGDIEATEQLIKACKILGIELLDHIVIGNNGFSSVPAQY